MASVPVNMDDLEMIVADCARDLLEKWVIESEIEDASLPEYAALAAETVAFVVDSFMSYLNGVMSEKEHEQS